MKVRVMYLANGPRAEIEGEGFSMSQALNPRRAPADCLDSEAEECRAKAADWLRRADRLQAAAQFLRGAK